MSDFTLPSVTDEMRRLSRFGMSIPAISRRTGVPESQIGGLIRRGLLAKPLGKCRYYCNHDFFHTIDTEPKAYWLGFLMADGCMVEKDRSHGRGGVNLLLAGYEKPHLEKYRVALEAEHPIEERWDTIRDKGRPERIQHNVKVRIQSEILFHDLMDKGCGPRKSLTLTFPDARQVPNGLLRHFMRGYFDGDGSISRCKQGGWQGSVIGTDAFVRRYGEVLMDQAATDRIHLRPHHTSRGISYLCFAQLPNLNRWRDFLYKDATVCLTRKWETFQLLPVRYHSNRRQEMLATLREKIPEPCAVFDSLHLRDLYGVNLENAQVVCKQALDSGLIVRHHSQGNHHFYTFPECQQPSPSPSSSRQAA